MNERGYWDDFAEAMTLTIEGERLIIGEIATCIRDEARVAWRWIAELLNGFSRMRHHPPV
jgi:hypothetical protein